MLKDKIVGIVADNYKLSYFQATLKGAGFTVLSVTEFTLKSSTIKVSCPEEGVNELAILTKKMNSLAKRSN